MANGEVDKARESESESIRKEIWKIADELRGAVDGWDFKSYVLGAMFYRYISENICDYINNSERSAGDERFDYKTISDTDAQDYKEDCISEKGFFILPSELFCRVESKAKTEEDYRKNLNTTLGEIFRHIEESTKGRESEKNFAGLFTDFDIASNKLGNEQKDKCNKLSKLLTGVAKMSLWSETVHRIDAFGDAYEFLMGMYASHAGKSGGEFFTPAEVSELLARLGTVGKTHINKVYDPACGSGSLLLKVGKVLDGTDANHIEEGFWGQEINLTTYNLCRINMFLHDVGFDRFHIAHGNTLTAPEFKEDEKADLVVSNPPYSIKWDGKDNASLIDDKRFSPAGVLAPKSKADLAFVMHALYYLSQSGTAVIVCFPGIMYRGGAEQKIRKYLVDGNYVDCVIQLSENLFYGTSIATCIMILKKSKPNITDILFIDATDECIKVTNNNKLTDANIKRIVDTYANRREVSNFSKRASFKEVAAQHYNLSVSTYVTQEDTREAIDIDELNAQIKDIVRHEEETRGEIERIIEELAV